MSNVANTDALPPIRWPISDENREQLFRRQISMATNPDVCSRPRAASAILSMSQRQVDGQPGAEAQRDDDAPDAVELLKRLFSGESSK